MVLCSVNSTGKRDNTCHMAKVIRCTKCLDLPAGACRLLEIIYNGLTHAQIRKIYSGGGGGHPNSQKVLTENFNKAKMNNLAIPEGGGVLTPCPPSLDPPMCRIKISHCTRNAMQKFHFFFQHKTTCSSWNQPIQWNVHSELLTRGILEHFVLVLCMNRVFVGTKSEETLNHISSPVI